MSSSEGSGADVPRTLAEVSEDDVLASIFPMLPSGDDVLVPPGDDTALLGTGGSVLATTDTMVRGRDWRDEWSTAQDVGAKVVVQNVADIAAMGGVATGLLVTLVADPGTPVAWVRDMTAGLAQAARAAGVAVVGGDLSSAPAGTMMVSVTALGDLQGRQPVLRSGASAGQVLAVAGSLGRSAAGLELLRRGDAGQWPPDEVAGPAAELVGYHCRPDPDPTQGPVAAEAGAGAMIDLSDGLVRDGNRIARASGVSLELDEGAVVAHVERLAPVLGERLARECVLAGGEEHTLLATFGAGSVPPAWHVIGRVREGEGLWLAGQRMTGGGWDHFAG